MNSPVPLWQAGEQVDPCCNGGWEELQRAQLSPPTRQASATVTFQQSVKGKVHTFPVSEIISFEKTKVILE